MSTEERAREAQTQQRRKTEHVQESMLNRAEAEVRDDIASNPTQEKAREASAEERIHDKNLKKNMLHRAEEEIQGTKDSSSGQ